MGWIRSPPDGGSLLSSRQLLILTTHFRLARTTNLPSSIRHFCDDLLCLDPSSTKRLRHDVRQLFGWCWTSTVVLALATTTTRVDGKDPTRRAAPTSTTRMKILLDFRFYGGGGVTLFSAEVVVHVVFRLDGEVANPGGRMRVTSACGHEFLQTTDNEFLLGVDGIGR